VKEVKTDVRWLVGRRTDGRTDGRPACLLVLGGGQRTDGRTVMQLTKNNDDDDTLKKEGNEKRFLTPMRSTQLD
jgi:hypothetical protein